MYLIFSLKAILDVREMIIFNRQYNIVRKIKKIKNKVNKKIYT